MVVPQVALSMLTLVPGGMGGSETYGRELARALGGTDEVAVTAYLPANVTGFAPGLRELHVRSVTSGASTIRRLSTLVSANLHAREIHAAMNGADVVHFPFTVPAPRPPRNLPYVQSLLDVQHLDLPNLFSPAERAYRRWFYEGAARGAAIVITISEFARERMVDLLHLDPERIRVAPLGVDLSRFVPNTGARDPFVLYPARGWPHKNHARLIRAMELLRVEHPQMRLVLTGGGLDALGGLPDWVNRLGLVSSEELRELYRSASVLAFPSLYEGFGLPPLEAMASGCPVAASNAGSIPEVCGDAAVLFDPTDPEAIAAGISEALARSQELQARGIVHSRAFTWDRCRDVHVAAYRDAIG